MTWIIYIENNKTKLNPHTVNEHVDTEIKNTTAFTITQKAEIIMYKSNKA